jgi:5'(3')-deoxyribonucleotidase
MTGHAAVAFLSSAGRVILIHGAIFLMIVNSALNSIKSLTDRANWNTIYFRFCVKPMPIFCSKVIEL